MSEFVTNTMNHREKKAGLIKELNGNVKRRPAIILFISTCFAYL